MQHRIKLADLYAAPGFIDPADGTAPSLDDGRVAALYAFLPKGISFAVTPDELVIVGPPLDRQARAEAAKLFDRASKRARAGEQDKAIQLYSLGLAIEPLTTVMATD